MSEPSVSQITKAVIEEITGNQANDVYDDADLVEDLGISQIELSKIIIAISQKLEIKLPDSTKKELLLAETVGDLIDIFEEEYEF